MPGFEDVLKADLSGLARAAADWTAMAGAYEAVQHRMEREVLPVTGGSLWVGPTAAAADLHLRPTRQQTVDAQTEARAVASIIADAHDDFASAQERLRRTVRAAEADGMRVTGTGAVVFDLGGLDPALRADYRHDADQQRERAAAAGRWARQIEGCLEEATAADRRAALRLRRAAKVGDPVNTFNGRALGGGDAADAARAAELARRLADGGRLGPEELAELGDLMKADSGRPEFGRTLLTALGPTGLLRLADELDLRINARGGPLRAEYDALRTSLADTVAGATRDPASGFYRDFRAGLREAGLRSVNEHRPGGGAEPVSGYQALATLLRHGGAGYGKEFLNDLGTDLLDAERSGRSRPAHQFNGPRPDLVHDPVDGVLGLMGRNPEAAALFLDPQSPGAGDRLAYLLRGRTWPSMSATTLYGPPVADPHTHRSGLAAALEAAATGDVAGGTGRHGGPHTPAQARVLQGVVDALDADGRGAEIHQDLRGPLAGALADYAQDTHRILSEHVGTAAHAGAWEDGGAGRLGGSSDHLVRVLRGVAEEPEAYAALYRAERAEAARTVAALPPDPGAEDADRALAGQRVGTALGAYDAVRASVLLDGKDDRMAWADRTGALVSTLGGTAAGFVPEGGELAAALAEHGAGAWAEHVKEEAQHRGNLDASDHHTAGLTESRRMVLEWGRLHGYGPDAPLVDRVSAAMDTGHDTGYHNAAVALGRNGQK
ncbi:hypothetical protein RMN57_27920 [Kitasatospora sp. CM 4170]|uniref:PE-PGRS family protein n=1 Tax=Kitasatospora aburaviensis TaxID=67265 RepID=A0ABW1EYF7_9ACTN|nr:hypothetical protein [Kitasatospora sp. CM 4170]WNM48245.1 hypothetical protein RMN57_27920 [Kitasatospora sp. CM 4170]